MPAETSFARLQCPAQEQLLAFQRGELSEADMESVSGHLSHCPRCEALLRELPESLITGLLRGSKPDPLQQEPEIRRLEEAARHLARARPQAEPLAPSAASQRGHTTVDQHPATPAPAEPMPTVVGLYEILEKIGSGGMGVVYRARHQAIKRLVALKMLRDARLGDAETLTRFCVEGEAAARVRHPNVVQILEFAQHEGHLYFTMEYLAGGSLSRRLEGKPLPQRLAARLVRDLAHGVYAVHQQRIIHRDLKPANVLLEGSADGPLEEMVPKVADFGLARLMDDVEGANTQTDAVLGTPPYMAPEQAAGRPTEISERTDVYALGAILYECLTGQPPFKGQSRMQTVSLVQSSPVLPPSRVCSELDPRLEAICLKCLSKSSADRYATAQALAYDLDRWLADRPTQVQPPGRLARLVGGARRRPGMLTAIALMLLLGGLGLGAAYWFSPEGRRREREHQLAHGQTQILIGDTGKPAWFDLVAGSQRCQTSIGPDATFNVDTWGRTIVELLHSPRRDHYRFQVDLRQDRSDFQGDLGIYVARCEHNTSGGVVHQFAALSYYDLRSDREQWRQHLQAGDFQKVRQPPPRPKGNRARLEPRLYADGPLRPWEPGFSTGPALIFTPTAPNEPTWRTLVLEVTATGIRGWWGDEPGSALSFVGELSATALVEGTKAYLEVRQRLQADDPHFHGLQPRFAPRGGLGLYVHQGSASFRHVVVEPLD